MSSYPTDPSPGEEPRPYGSMPPPQYSAGGALPEPPQEVQRASTMLYISIALSLLGLIVGFATRGSTEDAIREGNTALTDDEIAAAATFGLVLAGIIAIGFGILYFICARKMLEGKNWARVTPTVLIGIGLVLGLLTFTTGAIDGITMILQVASLVIGIAFLYFAWSRPSNEFFKAARIPR